MSSARVVCLVLVAFLCVAADASLARADMPPGGWGGRSGPFRSCGSGIGTGLAGIGLAWAALWTGHRFAKRKT
jgi:hypothetical protein